MLIITFIMILLIVSDKLLSLYLPELAVFLYSLIVSMTTFTWHQISFVIFFFFPQCFGRAFLSGFGRFNDLLSALLEFIIRRASVLYL